MARVIRKNIELGEITIDNDLYPRMGTFWQSVYKYSQNMKAGSTFPPIVLARHRNKTILVDGRHRLDATKLLKKPTIPAEIHLDWDRRRIFEEAIVRNISHGLSLSPYEIRKLIVKLKIMRYKGEDISRIVKVPLDKLDKFVAQRAISSITGKSIVKTPLKHLAGGEYNEEQRQIIEESQDLISAKGQISLLEQVAVLMENNLLNLENIRVQKLIDKLKELITQI